MHYILDKGEARGEGSLRCQGLSIREHMKVNSGFKEETGVEEFQSEVLELSFFLVIQKVKC